MPLLNAARMPVCLRRHGLVAVTARIHLPSPFRRFWFRAIRWHDMEQYFLR
jgi:hypothetical protein